MSLFLLNCIKFLIFFLIYLKLTLITFSIQTFEMEEKNAAVIPS